ncbi:MAG: hypothetical protein WCK74_12060 [Gemmatimonadaceae bacterium]
MSSEARATAPTTAPSMSTVFVDIPPGINSPLEQLGLHLLLAGASHPALRAYPRMLAGTGVKLPNRQQLELVKQLHFNMVEFEGRLARAATTHSVPATLIQPLGPTLVSDRSVIPRQCDRLVGLTTLIDTDIADTALARGRKADVLVAGSTWQAELLRSHGLSHVVVHSSGVATDIYRPQPATGGLANRFVIWSCGALDFSKGQDLIIAAMRIFHARHPEALLICNWNNRWPELMRGFEGARHVSAHPSLHGGELGIAAWAESNGLPPSAIAVVPSLPNPQLADFVREADVALFPARAESAPSTAALECLAMGIPTIIAANTGHLDIVHHGGCLPLTHQGPVTGAPATIRGTEGWGESSVEEIVERLESVYQDRAAAKQRATAAAEALAPLAWPTHTRRLLDTLLPIFQSATERPLA